jgi:hypothetical protein
MSCCRADGPPCSGCRPRSGGVLTYLSPRRYVRFIARTHQQWRSAWSIAFVGLLYSVYLTTISLHRDRRGLPVLPDLAHADDGDLWLADLPAARDACPASPGSAGCAGGDRWRWGMIVFLHLNYIGVIGKPPAEEDPIAARAGGAPRRSGREDVRSGMVSALSGSEGDVSAPRPSACRTSSAASARRRRGRRPSAATPASTRIPPGSSTGSATRK